MICSQLTREQAKKLYLEVLKDDDKKAMRKLCQEDLFFLLYVACKRVDLDNDWLYARCREVESNPDGYLDLWAREHYKSTIITFGKTIQDILNNPEITVGIASHTRPIAKAFLVQIKRELESNTFLQDLFPEVLYKNPQKESPRWSLDDGIIVKRKGNPKESTVEAWGLVDGQPTSKHYTLLIYDDVVTKESVSTPEMIKKVTESWEISTDLGAKGGQRRYVGTRYHGADTYRTMLDRGSAIPRIHAATDDGTMGGNPVFLSQEALAKKFKDQGSYTFACQQLQNPLADNAMGFKNEWLETYFEINKAQMNFYIIVDPAGEKKKSNDYTVMAVIGLGADKNFYLVDGLRDRLNLTERADALFALHQKWLPKNTGYEKYGMQSDIEHIKYVQEHKNYRFQITELGGAMSKNDRIRRLVPIFENHRFYLPTQLLFKGKDGKAHDFVLELKKDEFETFPVSTHDDMLDCISRIVEPDMKTTFPLVAGIVSGRPEFANTGAGKDYNPLN